MVRPEDGDETTDDPANGTAPLEGIITRVNKDRTFDVEFRLGGLELSVAADRLAVIESADSGVAEEDRVEDHHGGNGILFESAEEIDLVQAELDSLDRSGTGVVSLSSFVNVLKDQLEASSGHLSAVLRTVQAEFAGRKRNTVLYADFLSQQREKIARKGIAPLLSVMTRKKLFEAFNGEASLVGEKEGEVDGDKQREAHMTDKAFCRYLKGKVELTQEEIRTLTACFDVSGQGCVDKAQFLRFIRLGDLIPDAEQAETLAKVRALKEPSHQIFHKFTHRIQSKASRTNLATKLLSSFQAKDADDTGVVTKDCFSSTLRTLRVLNDEEDIAGISRLFGTSTGRRKRRSHVDYKRFLQAIQTRQGSVESVRLQMGTCMLACSRAGTDVLARFESSSEQYDLAAFVDILREELGLPMLAEDVHLIYAEICKQQGEEDAEQIESESIFKTLRKWEVNKEAEKVAKAVMKGVEIERFSEIVEEEYDTHEKNYVTRKQFMEALEKVKGKPVKLSAVRPLLECLDSQRVNKVAYAQLPPLLGQKKRKGSINSKCNDPYSITHLTCFTRREWRFFKRRRE